jgi:hypothetical protein
MEPIGIRAYRKGYQIAHRCRQCGVIRWNRVAEGTIQPDEVGELVCLMSGGIAAL